MLWEDNYLAHFGIKGQRWGLRRFQNEDGSLTPEGKEHYYGDKNSSPRRNKSGEENNADVVLRNASKFDHMPSSEKKAFGDRVLKSIDSFVKDMRNGREISDERNENFKKVEGWLYDQINRKSGSATGDPMTDANRAARKKLERSADDQNKRLDEIKKEIGYQKDFDTKKFKNWKDRQSQHISEMKRLKEAVEHDQIWQALNENTKRLQKNWAGVVLRDIGLRDTPENRAIIWPYIIEIWD